MSQKNKILTIGIPTFNRKEVLIKNINYILSLDILDRIELLVIDNNSDDDTFSILNSKYKNKFTFIKNETNIGFSKNTIKLFNCCKTKYLMWLPDEDFIYEENIYKLLNLLENNDYYFLCPQFYLNEKLYRGKNKNIALSYGDLRSASSHLSGVVFNITSTQDIINDFDNYRKFIISNDIAINGFRSPQSKWNFNVLDGLIESKIKWDAQDDSADYPYIIREINGERLWRMPVKVDDWAGEGKKYSPVELFDLWVEEYELALKNKTYFSIIFGIIS